jgi:tricorn protease
MKSPLAPQSDEETVATDASVGARAPNAALDTDECKNEGETKPTGEPAAKPDRDDDRTASANKDEKQGKKSDDKGAKETKEIPNVKIDFENISQRILALPVPPRNYDQLLAGKTHVLYLLERPLVDGVGPSGRILHKFNLCTRKTDKVLDNIGGFVISANGEKALYEELPPWNPIAPPAEVTRPTALDFITMSAPSTRVNFGC